MRLVKLYHLVLDPRPNAAIISQGASRESKALQQSRAKLNHAFYSRSGTLPRMSGVTSCT